MPSNEYFFKYLTPSSDDVRWGLYVNVAGYAHVAPNDAYPPKGHPAGYNFNWENGRVLHEYQINYITEGSGILETRSGNYKVQPGTVIILHPGMWHRYRPFKKIGWKEHFLGFLGDFTNNIFQETFFAHQKPVLYIGFQDNLIKNFFELIRHVKEEKQGYQQLCAGITLYMLSSILSITKNKDFSGRETEKKIRKSCIIIRESLHKNINIELLAHEVHLGYSHFRRAFKDYTGQSPAQYHLKLRLQRAQDLLVSTNLSIKQIAYEMGFQSNYYFTRIFTRKFGLTPTKSRESLKKG